MADQPQPEGGTRNARLTVVALLSLGLLARLALALMTDPEDAAALAESQDHLAMAASLAEGKGYVLPAIEAPRDGEGEAPPRAARPAPRPAKFAHGMPGYAAILAAVQARVEEPVRAAVLGQAACGTVVLGLAVWMAARLAGAWAGLIAVALLAFDPYQVCFSARVLPVVPAGLALTVAAAAAVGLVPAAETARRGWFWAVLAGLALAAAAYLEVWAASLIVPAGLVALVSKHRRRLLARWAVAAVILGAALAPWAARNARVVGAPVLTTDTGRRAFEGTPMGSRGGVVVSGRTDREAGGLDEAAQDLSYLRLATEQVSRAPLEWLGLGVGRVGRLWSPGPMRGAEDALHALAGYSSLLPVAVLALTGLWALRGRGVSAWLLLGPAWLTVVHLALGGAAYERLAVMPPLAVLGGVGLATLLGRRPPREGMAGT